MRRLLILLLFLPVTAPAAVVNLDTPQVMENSHPQAPETVSLGAEILRGVRAQASLQPLSEGDPDFDTEGANYRLQVDFVRPQSGEKILEGQAAARIFDAASEARSTVRLEVSAEHWSCALHLPEAGETMIKVGTQLPDGKKRIYRFFFDPTNLPGSPSTTPAG